MKNHLKMLENIDKLYDKFTSYSVLKNGKMSIDKFFNNLGIIIDYDELRFNQHFFDYNIQTCFVNDFNLPFNLYYDEENETYFGKYYTQKIVSAKDYSRKFYLSNSFVIWCHLVFSLLTILKKHKHGLIYSKYKIFSPIVCIINALYSTFFIERDYKKIENLISNIDKCENFIENDYKIYRRVLLEEKIKNICKEKI